MTDLFKDKTPSGVYSDEDRLPVMQAKLCDQDRFFNEARLPGARKYPMDVVSAPKVRRGHDY